MTMPFGKYLGWDLSEIPDDYLDWLYSLPDLRPRLANAVKQEWQSRFDPQEEESSAPPAFDGFSDPQDREMLAELVQAGYRTLARKYHPDVGGSTPLMQRLNRLMERLRVQIV